MKNQSFIIVYAAATTLVAAMLCSLCGCGGKTSNGELTVLDLEAAIDNHRVFDLAEISADIDFIALDDSRKEGLLGEIRIIEESKNRFYILERENGPVKVFDREGRFLSSRGVIGRGPDEFLSVNRMTVDWERDNLYLAVYTGTVQSVTRGGIQPVIGYDASGRIFTRNDSVPNGRMAYYDDKIILVRSSQNFDPEPNSKITLLEAFSSDLIHNASLDVEDRGSGTVVMITTSDGLAAKADASNIMSVSVIEASPPVLSGSGKSLIIKQGRSDTLYNYKNGTLVPAYRLDYGKYAFPDGAFGMSPTASFDKGRAVGNIYEGDRYIIVKTGVGSLSDCLLFDKKDLSTGFSATGGPEKKPGFFLNGLAFTPMYIRDNRLVGYISALSIADNAEKLTNPDLRALAATLAEDSNPVIVIATLK